MSDLTVRLTRCPVTIGERRCPIKHPSEMFCCRGHWRALPWHLRDAVNTARGDDPDGLAREWLQASEDALAHLEMRAARDMSRPKTP